MILLSLLEYFAFFLGFELKRMTYFLKVLHDKNICLYIRTVLESDLGSFIWFLECSLRKISELLPP